MARATITPVLRYRNASAAARWLCEAFGFGEHDRAQELDGHVRYISLRLGDSFVLVRPVANSVFDDLMVQPEAIGGGNTQVCYLTIPDTDEHRARAEAAGARMELEPQDDGLGGRFYTCRDLEGHLWSFGTRTYGVAHDVAGAFEPAELSPSQPSTAIAAAPAGRDARKSAVRSGLLPSIGIAAAAAALGVGGWIFYGTYAGGPSKTSAAMSTATATRIEEALEQLTHERNRRLAAEDAAREAATRLAEERTAAADLRQTLQRAQAELEQARQAKEEAVKALGSSKQLLEQHRLAKERAEAERAVAREQAAEEQAKQATLAKLASEETEGMRAQLAKQEQDNLIEKEQLREAKAALLAAKREIEDRRAGQLEPMSPDTPDLPENSLCVLAVQGKIPSGHKGPNTWLAANLGRLCRGAETSVEPAKCFEDLMRGKVNWGAGSTWVTSNALALCGGTRNARRTLDCFTKKVASNETWQIAIGQCKTN